MPGVVRGGPDDLFKDAARMSRVAVEALTLRVLEKPGGASGASSDSELWRLAARVTGAQNDTRAWRAFRCRQVRPAFGRGRGVD